jgi:hypothetical protein
LVFPFYKRGKGKPKSQGTLKLSITETLETFPFKAKSNLKPGKNFNWAIVIKNPTGNEMILILAILGCQQKSQLRHADRATVLLVAIELAAAGYRVAPTRPN